MKNKLFLIVPVALLFCFYKSFAQEHVKGLCQNIEIKNAVPFIQHHTRAINLPFIDDFSSTQIWPNINNWKDSDVYINNTFSPQPITKGIATLDALNSSGNSYYPNGQFIKYYADSLTSQEINLQGKTAADSIYLSFYFQPQGLGFSPEPGDSLLLFLKTNTGAWVKTWSAPGNALQPWSQVMIAVTATNYLHSTFQFRFVNIASPNTNDDVWNIDYVRIAVNRTKLDTVLNDVSFTSAPSSVFANYTAMPARQFVGFPQEQAGNFSAYIKNNKVSITNAVVNVRATQEPLSTILKIDSTSVTMIANVEETADFNLYNTVGLTNTAKNIKHTYFIKPSSSPTDIKTNDTIIKNNELKDFFAYDDGSAEQAYFLFAAPNLPANTALQFHLNIADSVQGLAIRFASQVPSGAGKLFSVVLYKTLGVSSASQQVLYQQDFNTLQYTNDREGFSYYKFDNAQYLDTGVYYIGVLQPANSGSDSIYFGLDINNNTNLNKLFYNVDGSWQASGTQGSIMLRPLVGNVFNPTAIHTVKQAIDKLVVFPNPAENAVTIETNKNFDAIIITDLQGKVFYFNKTKSAKNINISSMQPGMYSVQLISNNKVISQAAFLKK